MAIIRVEWQPPKAAQASTHQLLAAVCAGPSQPHAQTRSRGPSTLPPPGLKTWRAPCMANRLRTVMCERVVREHEFERGTGQRTNAASVIITCAGGSPTPVGPQRAPSGPPRKGGGRAPGSQVCAGDSGGGITVSREPEGDSMHPAPGLHPKNHCGRHRRVKKGETHPSNRHQARPPRSHHHSTRWPKRTPPSGGARVLLGVC